MKKEGLFPLVHGVRSLALARRLRREARFVDVVPAWGHLTVVVDPHRDDANDALAALRALPGKVEQEGEGEGRSSSSSRIAKALASDAVAPALAGGSEKRIGDGGGDRRCARYANS